jgi:hypothetical protein
MIKLFTILLALIVGLSFGGMTFAKSMGDASSVQSTFPLSADGDTDDKDKEGEDQKMDNGKTGDDKGEDEKEGK